jgi:hypothetical protein
VRVCVGAEGVTLACGLSAQATLEQAEDLATTRALERLGLAAPAPAGVPAPAVIVPNQAQSLVAPPPLTLVPKPPTPAQSPPAVSATATAIPTVTPPDLEYESNLPAPEPPPIALATPPAPAPPDDLLAVPDDFGPDLMNIGAGPVAAVDLSDIIAQTDVELQRLGWDVNQGREFLEKTYGKRSRHDLTDDELLEFLLYLETQSPPASH